MKIILQCICVLSAHPQTQLLSTTNIHLRLYLNLYFYMSFNLYLFSIPLKNFNNKNLATNKVINYLSPQIRRRVHRTLSNPAEGAQRLARFFTPSWVTDWNHGGDVRGVGRAWADRTKVRCLWRFSCLRLGWADCLCRHGTLRTMNSWSTTVPLTLGRM
jgi:hypothetical protein